MGNIKLGICQWAIPLSGPYGCILAGDFGLEGVELELGEYENGLPLSKKTVKKIYKKIANNYNIEYPSLATNALLNYGLSNSPESEKGKVVKIIVDTAIETAEELGIEVIQLPSFEDGEINTQEDFENTVDHLKNACDAASSSHITIATENVLSVDNNNRLFERVDKDNLKLMFDTQNYFLFKGYNPSEIIESLHGKICQTHIKDGSDSMSSALLGQGNSGFFQSATSFKKVNFSGWVLLENYYDKWPLLDDHTTDPFELWERDISIAREHFNW